MNFHKKTKVNGFLIKHFQISLVIRLSSLKRISISFRMRIRFRIRMSEKIIIKMSLKRLSNC